MDLQVIQSKIYEIKGFIIMFDFDLAKFYGVSTGRLKEQVTRNIKRFPSHFMFQLSKEEWKEVIANCGNLPNTVKFSPVPPFCFTEQGVAMVSAVLTSEQAIEVSIAIMDAFVKLRKMITGYSELNRKLEEFMVDTDMRFADVMSILDEMLRIRQIENQPRKQIQGFKNDE